MQGLDGGWDSMDDSLDEEDSGDESAPTCSCCRGGAREGGPFSLPGGHQAASEAVPPPKRLLKASQVRAARGWRPRARGLSLLTLAPQRSVFQARFAERIGLELFEMTAEEARARRPARARPGSLVSPRLVAGGRLLRALHAVVGNLLDGRGGPGDAGGGTCGG